MHLRDWLFYKKQGIKQRLGYPIPHRTLPFSADPGTDYSDRASSDLGRIFFAHQGRPITKWVDYIDLYDRHFSRFRGTEVRLLEIGVFNGGSLEIWREYFGPHAQIVGIDITPECADRVDPPNRVRIGSQDDAAFLQSVVSEMGGVDIVLDDGSHNAGHQMASFKALFPLLSNGGIYAIEDMHTAYWPGDYAGGYQREGTAVELVKQLIDDLHAWFHDRGEALAPKESIAGVHAYESIVFIDKDKKKRPVAIDR
jgi:cephalosporin hydroxylase